MTYLEFYNLNVKNDMNNQSPEWQSGITTT